MERSVALKLIGVALAVYAIRCALLLPALFVGPAEPGLLACLLVETIAAFVAAVGLFVYAPWGAIATVVLGAAIAATELVEASFFGIIAMDHAIVVGAVAVLVAIVIAVYASGPRRMVV